jgi:uncharacterized protein (TIGR03067 family)
MFKSIIKGKFKFKIDPSLKPKTIDAEIIQAPKEEHKGKTALGIFTLEGDNLKWCLNEPGNTERPKEFAGPAETKVVLATFKREKP